MKKEEAKQKIFDYFNEGNLNEILNIVDTIYDATNQKDERPSEFWSWLEIIGWDYDHKDNPSRWSNENGIEKTEEDLYSEFKRTL